MDSLHSTMNQHVKGKHLHGLKECWQKIYNSIK
ncbi:Protein of unknown function [Lactobacillus helveticus CIRM-BIA 101]|nr:hypothetical protein [Lactobacillus helveticus]CDI66429.1 Protein of unknown function [Lactobacillus helveticus CIRM-BIA 101]